MREAADKISAPQEELVVRQYRDHEGKPAAANEAITLARASRDYSELRAAEQLVADSENAKELAARIAASTFSFIFS